MDLDNKIKSCQKCLLYKSCNQPIPWDGNFNSKILFIWEAPWAEEDKQHKPFVWRSWQLLTSILEKIWLFRNKDYYITNIVKCRPPNNRDPKLEEIQICKDYLIQQIKIMKPKIIITLWRFSMNFIITSLSISKDRWKIFLIKQLYNTTFEKPIIFMPVYHPAVALYNPSKKDIIEKDLTKINIISNYLKDVKLKKYCS